MLKIQIKKYNDKINRNNTLKTTTTHEFFENPKPDFSQTIPKIIKL